MPAQLTLPPEPRAAGRARRWVREELTDMARLDLIDSAVLGVSELVTNALLHVRSEIALQIRDNSDGLRVEVYDDSPHLFAGAPNLPGESRATNPSTVGRGLLIVASVSQDWGIDYDGERKCVWFRPTAAVARDTDSAAHDVERRAAETAETAASSVPGHDLVRVVLIDVPVKLMSYYRVRFRDLRREMTLIALSGEEEGTAAHRLHATAQVLERYRHVGDASNQRIDRAVAAGKDRATLDYDLPRVMIEAIDEMGQALQAADEFCRERRMLTLAAGPQEKAVRSWYIGQIIEQAKGAAPTAWTGDFEVTDPEPLADSTDAGDH